MRSPDLLLENIRCTIFALNCDRRGSCPLTSYVAVETANSYGQQAGSSLASDQELQRASSSCRWKMKRESLMPSSHLTCMNVNVSWSVAQSFFWLKALFRIRM